MKKYFIRAIIFMVGFMITLLLLDLITGDMQPFREYVEQTVYRCRWQAYSYKVNSIYDT